MTLFFEVTPHTFLPRGITMPPKRSVVLPTTDELNGQLESDAGLEELPDFEPATDGTYTADADGFNVRPSEQCGASSDFGTHCTFMYFHPGRHSWQAEQAELPGVPAPEPHVVETPEPDDFDVPYEATFNKRGYVVAPGIRIIAEQLIHDTPEFAHLRGLQVRYFWKRRGGLKGGNPRLGQVKRPTDLAAYALGEPPLVLWLAADHCLAQTLSQTQITVLIFDTLAHVVADPDDHDSFRVVGDDFSGMNLTVRKFGLWSMDLNEAAVNLRQLPIDQPLALDVIEAKDDE